MAVRLQDLNVKLFTDGADKVQIREMAEQSWIRGFTTNPSLMRAAKVSDYASYAREVVAAVPDRHISFEVFSDDIAEMIEQARLISTWGANVYVKLPVSTTRGEPLFRAVHALSHDGVKVNLTAVFTAEQVADGIDALREVPLLACRIRRSSRRCRYRLSADHARCGQAGACDRKCRGHMGVDTGGLQCNRGRRNEMSHHHRAGSGAKKAAIAWNQDRGGAIARCGQDLSQRRRIGRIDIACWHISRVTEACKLEECSVSMRRITKVQTRPAVRRVTRLARHTVMSFGLFDPPEILAQEHEAPVTV
jgi:hypothetical protein